MKKLIYLVVFLLTLSLALAVTVKTDKAEYNGNELATISVDCSGTSIVKIKDPFDNLADIKSGENSWKAVYNTLSSSSDGKYKITASCQEGTAEAYFCVDEPGCNDCKDGDVISVANCYCRSPLQNVNGICTTAPVPQPQAPSGGGGGGGWAAKQCGDFIDNDKDGLVDYPKDPGCLSKYDDDESNYVAGGCVQSWICSEWGECSSGTNYRTCIDENSCGGSEELKPTEQKSCEQPIQEEEYRYVPPAQIFEEEPILPSIEQPSFWDNYKFYFAAGIAGLMLLILIILLAVHFLKPKTAYNINELRDWIKREKEAGTSEEDVRDILRQNTGWKEKEIDEAFKRL